MTDDPQSVAAALAQRIVLEQALCHVSLLIERLLFYNRNLGLLPRTSSASDPLGPIVVSDEDVATIMAGFRKIGRTEPARRAELLADPLAADIAESRAALISALAAPGAKRLGFVSLVKALGLADTVLDPLLLALAPEWDARIGRMFGFLNNDTTRQRPTFSHLQMALQQGFSTVSVEAFSTIERLLLRPGLIELDGGAEVPQPSQTVRVPSHIIELSRATLHADAAVAVRSWDRLYWDPEDKDALRQALCRELVERRDFNRLIVLEGTPGSGRAAAARATAEALGLGSVLCELSAAQPVAQLEGQITAQLFRARLTGAVLIVRSDGALATRAEAWTRLAKLGALLEVRCMVLVRSDEQLPADGSGAFVRLTMPHLRPIERRHLWAEALPAAGLLAADAVLDDISTRFDITPGRLHSLVGEMVLRRGGRRTDGAIDMVNKADMVDVVDVADALRDITTQKLKDQATLHVADYSLDDLVLEPSARGRLDELIHRMRHRYQVMDGWHFGGRSRRGYGLSALFAGPPGTGKTAAAGAVARALDIDLYIVDLSRIMSKWIGETEQNLARVFDEAEASSVALLFDEADSLFGKRSSDVKSSSDRYANVTVNYLLQRMERYSGLAILTTNLESAIDAAFSRRITSRVFFAAPDEQHRLKLWRQLLPAAASFGPDVNLSELARLLDMPGARIRTALMRAAFRAAASGRQHPVLTQSDIYWAAILEYEDMGRLPPLRPIEPEAESVVGARAAGPADRARKTDGARAASPVDRARKTDGTRAADPVDRASAVDDTTRPAAPDSAENPKLPAHLRRPALTRLPFPRRDGR